MGEIRIGTSGWNYADWRLAVYPKGMPTRAWLVHYATLFDTVEVNSTFYRLAKPSAVAPLAESPKLGPVLWQLPDREQLDIERLASALDALPPGMHCFEFRHPSWFCAPVLDVLRWHGVALAIGDHPERPWQPWTTTTTWGFLRLHYGHRGRRGNYSDTELRELAQRVTALAED